MRARRAARGAAAGAAIGIGGTLVLALNLAGTAVALAFPAALVYWFYGKNAGMTFWETFAWVEFVGGLIGAAVMLLSAPAQDSPLGAVALSLVFVGISLGIAFGFGILGGSDSPRAAAASAPASASQPNYASDYSLSDLTGMTARCVEGGDSQQFCGCATTELTNRFSRAELLQVSSAARFDDLPDVLAKRASQAVKKIEGACRP